jgi:hypothetical protein
VKQTQSTLGGINLGESDSSTTVQRRSWSGGRSEHDVSAAWLAGGSFDHASRAGAGYRNFENMMRLSPLESSAGKSVVRFSPRFLRPVNGAEKPQRPLLLFRFWNVQHRLSTALRIEICNLFFLNHSPRWHLFRWRGPKTKKE